MKRSAIISTPAIPPVVLGTNGRLPFIVQAAAQTAVRADELAAAIPADLAPEQSDGLACVYCGRMDTTQRPVGVRNGVQLFACAPACPADDSELADVLADAVPAVLARTIPGVDADTAAAIAADITNRLTGTEQLAADTETPREHQEPTGVTPYGPEDLAFNSALDAVEAAFAASTNTEDTWLALRAAVNITAGKDGWV